MRTLLIVVVVIGLAASIGPIVIGSRSFDGQVVESPYDRGLDWDAERKAREESPIQPQLLTRSFHTGLNPVTILLKGPRDVVAEAEFRLDVTRPHTAADDATYALLPGEDENTFAADIDFSDTGAWKLLLVIRGEKTDARFSWQIQVDEMPQSPHGKN